MATTDEIIKYVMNSPENTNPGILRELLNEHGGAGGGVGIYTFPADGYGMPLATLGEIRTAVASGNIMLGVNQQDNTTKYFLVEQFVEQGDSHPSFITLSNIMYQSTSGADDATWKVYE